MRARWALLGLVAALPGFGLFGCGSDDEDDGRTYTLDEVCAETVPVICKKRESCCTASGVGFDQAGCEAHEMAECMQNVSDVEAGLMEFDGSKVDACIDAFDAFLAQCRVPLADLVRNLQSLRPCAGVWTGQKDIGAACTRGAECKPSADANTFTNCSDQGRCQRVTIVGNGDGCNLTGDDVRICADGLYCDTQLVGNATCKQAVAVGQSCDPLQQDCSLGAYCAIGSQSCDAAHGAGEDCVVFSQCESLSCTGGQCDPAEPIVGGQECTG